MSRHTLASAFLCAVSLVSISAVSIPAHAQSGCSGQPGPGLVCGNAQAAQALPGFYSQTTLLDRGFGSGQGTVLNRTVLGWLATVAPTLGINGGTGGSIILNGATSGSATISVPAAAGTVTFQLPNSNGTNNQVLSTDGSGHLSWQTLTGTGTVTSVGLSMPGIFSVTGSPVTSNGTLTASLANQSANLVWAGPSTGVSAAPTFRSLVGADLPNPSSSTLGGIQSYAGVSSQWIRSISTSGVPASSQPAFSDISGTLAPSQCPASGLATLGCVNAINGTASQWLRALSTSGVFTSSQPTFADIAGAASLSQIQSIGNNTVLGNNSGGTAVPSTLSASDVLDMIGSTRGSVTYRGASAWAALTPGTSGQVLTSNGAGADPSWSTITGTGTVTSVGSGTGLTGGPITTTGTLSLAPIATGNVLANVSGISAAPSANTPSAVLDVIGSTQGQIPYRGASSWAALNPGTAGQVLQTNGAGSSPSWANVGSVSNVTISAGAGISTSGTCNISASGTCTVSTAAGVDTNTLNSVTANYTIQTSDCGKTVQAGTGSTGQFTVTLPAVTGFDTKCVVTIVNGDTGRGKKLSGFPTTMTSPNILWPAQGVTVKIVNGAWTAPQNPGRWKSPNNVTGYIDAINGSDSNDCLAAGSGNACQSFNGLVRTYIKDMWDLTGTSTFSAGNTGGNALVNVQLADNHTTTGTCTTCYSLAHIAFTPVGNEGRATIVIKGLGSSTIISDTGGAAVGAYGPVNIELYNLQVGQLSCASSPQAGGGIEAADGANIRLAGGVVLACASGAQMSAYNRGSINLDATTTMEGGGSYSLSAIDGGIINFNGNTMQCNGSMNFSQQTAFAYRFGEINIQGVTWSGCSGVTGTRYNANYLSLISTGTGSPNTTIPGNSNGSANNNSVVD
ncbi:beta strand repeat-containing protein [Bradyrhizobium oligotrophicum]|uniref:beta strand repeat-containing protein n=1 Tax=Bradyrhizobium oligotrophicum TaxID=44255 RepID=UPI003EBFF0F8